MTDIEIEHAHDSEGEEHSEHDGEGEEHSEHDGEEPAYEWTSKPVKQLSKSERARLIEDFENGSDNPYFKVNRLKNGSYRVTKRSNPLLNETPEHVSERVNKRYEGKRLTTEQMLLEHVFELERKCEVMRMKHKKLKKRYNKLESDIFSDDDELNVQEVTPERDVEQPVHEVNYAEPAHAEPAIATFRRPVKRTWRNMLNNA